MISANQTILFQGDSITDAGRNFEDIQANTIGGLGSGYCVLIAAGLLASRPADNLKFLNRGISGHRVTDLLARWRVDAINLKPDVLSILIGVNDTWHKFTYNNGCDVELYEKTYRLLLETTRKELPNTRLVLCEAFAFPCGPVTKEWCEELKERSAVVQKLAKETKSVFVPFQQLFDSLLSQASQEYMASRRRAPLARWTFHDGRVLEKIRTMKITLIHNPTAGEEAYTGKKLTNLLKKADHDVTYVSVKEAAYKNIYKHSADLFLAAGGDGTVRRVAQQAISRGVPMSILPIGTNNYVAEALGISATPETLISNLDTARKVKLDAGEVKGPWGDVKFITGCGFALLPTCLRTVERRRKQGKNIEYLSLLREKATRFKAQYCEVFLDGNDVSGEYFLIEIMNIPAIAPGLVFAPDAKMADGYMEFVMALEADRPAFVKALESEAERYSFTLPSRQFKHMHMEIPDSLTHIDDRLRPKVDDSLPTHGYIDIHVLSEAVEFLIPADSSKTAKK